MPLIGDFVDLIAPVAPSTPGADVFERFQTEPNTLALAVVDDDGRPLGIIERNAFTLRMAAEFGRALYARRPAESLMDRNAPDTLRDTPQSGYDDTKALIERWHGRGRAGYAISPRFAITSSPQQLEMAGALATEHPDCHIQTHLSENREEIAFAASLYPEASDYLNIYERYGLLGGKMLLGHCIHLEEREVQYLAETGAHPVFCPTSNLFLGSGCFDHARLDKAGIQSAIATDIGAGTSYSMLQTLNEGYKVLQLQSQSLHAMRGFHWMTRGNAEVLGLADRIGTLDEGTEADIVVLDARATPAMALRMDRVETLAEELFVLLVMGDDRAVAQTYIAGEPHKETRR